jgi:hypothetical protein
MEESDKRKETFEMSDKHDDFLPLDDVFLKNVERGIDQEILTKVLAKRSRKTESRVDQISKKMNTASALMRRWQCYQARRAASGDPTTDAHHILVVMLSNAERVFTETQQLISQLNESELTQIWSSEYQAHNCNAKSVYDLKCKK